jgi:hypothetical protein
MATVLKRAFNYGPGAARWATVRVETDGSIYIGRLYVPDSRKRVSDVLSDERPFLHLIDVTTNHGSTRDAFIAVNKRFVKTVRILEEAGEAAETERKLA